MPAAELEGEEVEEARRLYALLRQQLAELRQASLQVRVHSNCSFTAAEVQHKSTAFLHNRVFNSINHLARAETCPWQCTPLPCLQLRASLGLQPFTSQLAAPAAAGGLQLPPLEVTHFLVADSADFLAVQVNTAGGWHECGLGAGGCWELECG